MPAITSSAAWKALDAHRKEAEWQPLRDLLAEPGRAGRFNGLSFECDDLFLDLSRNRFAGDTLALLVDLARAAGIEERRAAMFAGVAINRSEDRAVLHAALRDKSGLTAAAGVADEVGVMAARMEGFVSAVRSGGLTGAGGARFTDIVNLGIGGSQLGPMMVSHALGTGSADGPRVHFVANVDGADLSGVLGGLDPASTLFLVASKSFSTQETMANAVSARNWLTAKLGDGAVADHFVALSVNAAAAAEFGIREDRRFGFWNWVGGRFSLWSAAGLSIPLGAGWPAFEDLQAGAHAMDRHFATAPLEANLPVLLALSGIWNNNFLGIGSHAVLPYDERLKHFPSFLQQLEMESNGKSVDADGAPVSTLTAPMVFGSTGTNAQHSFMQLFHQGPVDVACDFIAAARPEHGLAGHHDKLIANMLAQAEALALGTGDEVPPHRRCPGNRPSNIILLRELNARTLGMLIALYEHKVFVQGIVWGINSFDQFGVELGKEIAGRLLPQLTDDEGSAGGVGIISKYRSWRGEDA